MIPALLTRMSREPNSSTAVRIRAALSPRSATSPAWATAVPPAARISSTTASAGLSSGEPSSDKPKSLTTTRAPARASSSASTRPRPRPAPVTIATLPSSDVVVMGPLSCRLGGERRAQPQQVRGCSAEQELGLLGFAEVAVQWVLAVDAHSPVHVVRGVEHAVRRLGGPPLGDRNLVTGG